MKNKYAKLAVAFLTLFSLSSVFALTLPVNMTLELNKSSTDSNMSILVSPSAPLQGFSVVPGSLPTNLSPISKAPQSYLPAFTLTSNGTRMPAGHLIISFYGIIGGYAINSAACTGGLYRGCSVDVNPDGELSVNGPGRVIIIGPEGVTQCHLSASNLNKLPTLKLSCQDSR